MTHFRQDTRFHDRARFLRSDDEPTLLRNRPPSATPVPLEPIELPTVIDDPMDLKHALSVLLGDPLIQVSGAATLGIAAIVLTGAVGFLLGLLVA